MKRLTMLDVHQAIQESADRFQYVETSDMSRLGQYLMARGPQIHETLARAKMRSSGRPGVRIFVPAHIFGVLGAGDIGTFYGMDVVIADVPNLIIGEIVDGGE